MIEGVSTSVAVVFLLTTIAAVWFLLRASEPAGKTSLPVRILYFTLPLWLLLTGFLATSGFYREFQAMPPRIILFGVLPAIVFIVAYFLFFRKTFVEKVDIKLLTLIHIVRVPVELVLLSLSLAGAVPKLMTFNGFNFDIIAGMTAPIVYFIAFRRGTVHRAILVVWNIASMLLLANIVILAVLSFPSPFQQLSIEQPNIAVAYLPYIWLPTIVVPIVLFSHLASLYKLLQAKPAVG